MLTTLIEGHMFRAKEIIVVAPAQYRWMWKQLTLIDQRYIWVHACEPPPCIRRSVYMNPRLMALSWCSSAVAPLRSLLAMTTPFRRLLSMLKGAPFSG